MPWLKPIATANYGLNGLVFEQFLSDSAKRHNFGLFVPPFSI